MDELDPGKFKTHPPEVPAFSTWARETLKRVAKSHGIPERMVNGGISYSSHRADSQRWNERV